jgi:xylulose-5-phosphate/fructose-6-phosphate phosphoketolase
MPGEVIDRPNPEPLPSNLPDYLAKLQVALPHQTLDEKTCDALLKFRRAASYIAAGMKLKFGYIGTDRNPNSRSKR